MLLETKCVNPFSTQYDVISVSTKSAAPPDVKHDLINAREEEGKAYDKLRLKRMHIRTSMKGSLNYSSRPSVPLKFKKDKCSWKRCHSKSKLFGNISLVATTRNLDMREVVKHP